MNRHKIFSLYSKRQLSYFVFRSPVAVEFINRKTKYINVVEIFQDKMAFKYTCILLYVSLAFLLAQAKHLKKGNTKQKGKYGILD